MKRITKRVLIDLMAIVLVIVIVLFGGAYFFRDRIKALAIAEINKQMTEPFDIKGDVNFSLLKHFPFASLSFHDVSIRNKLQGGPQYFLRVGELSCLFDVPGLLKNKIEISRIHFYDGEVNIYIDANGDADYEIFKPARDTTTSAPASPLNLDLRKAVIKNIHFTYVTGHQEEDISLQIEKLTLGGNLHSERFDMETNGNMMIEQVRLNGTEYLTHKAFYSDITVDVNQKENRFSLNKATIEIEKNRFDVSGYFVSGKKTSYVNFAAKTQGKDIARLIALIPVKFKSTLEGGGGSGAFEVEAKVSGNISAGINPDIAVTAMLDRARIIIPRVRLPLTYVSMVAWFHRDSVGDDELLIKKFHSEFDGQPQNFDLKLTHLSSPDFVFNADGVANLHDLRTFFSDSILQAAEGLVTFQKFHIEGSKKAMSEPEPKFKASGNFTMKGVEIKTGGVTYGNINGHLEYNEQDITIQGFTLKFLNTDVAFDGRVTNIIAYALSRDRSATTTDVTLGLDGRLHIRELNLSRIMAAYAAPAAPAGKVTVADTAKAVIDPRDMFNINGHVTVAIDKFVYQKMVFDDLKADLGLTPYRMDINSMSTHTMGGNVANKGYITLTPDRQMIFDFGMDIDKVDLPVALRECGNFGQTALTDQNLKGLLTADIQLKTVWNNYTDIDLSKVEGNLNCNVLHGELNNFGPVKSAAAFVKIDELNHIIFSDLNMQITIKDKVINIPVLEVQSSALNLMMAGTHTMDNIADYQIKVNLRKLLAAKFGKTENDDSNIEKNPFEGLNLFLTIQGDVDHLKIKYDRRAVRKKLKDDLKEQKAELKEIFKEDKNKKTKGTEEVSREEKYYEKHKKKFEQDTVR